MRTTAKAIYLLSDIAATRDFLESVTDEENADRILKSICEECKNITVAECDRLYKEIKNMQ